MLDAARARPRRPPVASLPDAAAARVREVVDAAPPLTAEQRHRLAALLLTPRTAGEANAA